jgi:type IV fimbrial biogenesis protein FimT
VNGPNGSDRQQGFTLIELMVTLVLLGVLVTIAAPSFQGMRDRLRIRAAAEAVYSHLEFARSESIKEYRTLFVCIMPGDGSTSADWCLGISNATGCDCMTAGSCQFGAAGSLLERTLESSAFEGVTLSANLAEIRLDGTRGLSSSTGTITLTSAGGLVVKVIQSRLGRTRHCSDDPLGYPSCS